MSEFSGDAGTIYVRKSKDSDERLYEVWFEDFCILGTGDSEIEALKDAVDQTKEIGRLISDAIIATLTTVDADDVSTAAGTGD